MGCYILEYLCDKYVESLVMMIGERSLKLIMICCDAKNILEGHYKSTSSPQTSSFELEKAPKHTSNRAHRFTDLSRIGLVEWNSAKEFCD